MGAGAFKNRGTGVRRTAYSPSFSGSEVGTQSISPLLWAINSGNWLAAEPWTEGSEAM